MGCGFDPRYKNHHPVKYIMRAQYMFKGKFEIGGLNPYAKDTTISLYRHNKESKEYTTENFKKSIDINKMGWSEIHQALFYRDENGKLWKATFEECHESET
jgi:hypothetical protein